MLQSVAQGGSEATSSALGTYAGYRIGAKSDKIAFQRQKWLMSNAHQMEVDDLRAAGLNPILSAGGSGAHSASVSNTAGSSAMAGMATGANVGRSLGSLNQQEIKERIENVRASTATQKAQQKEVEERTAAEYGRTYMVTAKDESGNIIRKKNGDPVMEIQHIPGRADVDRERIDMDNRIKGPEYEKQKALEQAYRDNPALRNGAIILDAASSVIPSAKGLKELMKKGGTKK